MERTSGESTPSSFLYQRCSDQRLLFASNTAIIGVTCSIICHVECMVLVQGLPKSFQYPLSVSRLTLIISLLVSLSSLHFVSRASVFASTRIYSRKNMKDVAEYPTMSFLSLPKPHFRYATPLFTNILSKMLNLD